MTGTLTARLALFAAKTIVGPPIARLIGKLIAVFEKGSVHTNNLKLLKL